MTFGIFGKIFKKRSTSQPANNSNVSNKNTKPINSSFPNLNKEFNKNRPNSADPKSLGQFNPESVDTDDDQTTNVSATLKTRTQSRISNVKPDNTNTLTSTGALSTKKTSTGYESSSESSEGKKSKSSLEFLETLTGTTNRQNEEESLSQEIKQAQTTDHLEDITSVSSNVSPRLKQSQISQGQVIQPRLQQQQQYQPQPQSRNSNQTLAEIIKDRQKTRPQNQTKQIGTLQSITDPYNKTGSTNQSVTFKEPAESDIIYTTAYKNEAFQNMIKENKSLKDKNENLQRQLLETKTKLKQDTDKLIIKVHESLSKGMNEQDKQALIKTLISKQQEASERKINEQASLIKLLESKCKSLESELERLMQDSNSELRNQVKNLKEDNSILKGKIQERDDAIRQMKLKVNDLTDKFNSLIEENSDLRTKLDKWPETLETRMVKIKSQAELVLEENKVLTSQLQKEEKKLIDSEKFKIQEIGRLSRKIVVYESDRIELLNQIDLLKSNNDEILKKYNDLSVEVQRRIKLDEHLNQVGDLRRKIEEINVHHKQELENTILRLQAIENDKKDLIIKLTNSEAEIKRLTAENQVFDKALNEGIGKKTQRRIQDLQKKLELTQINEKTAFVCLEKLTKETDKIKIEKEMFENLAKANESDSKEKDKIIAEQSLRLTKLEDHYSEFKEKASNKLAHAMEKLQRKESENLALKIEHEKKINRILKMVGKKQNQIDEFIKEKRMNFTESENIWQDTLSFDNRKLKEVLMDLKSKPDEFITFSAKS